MLTIGIESSCDDTSIAVLEDDNHLLSSIVSSQAQHDAFGGVVPELASRAHTSNIIPVYRAALAQAGVEPADLDLIGVTNRPGLIGSLMVGGAFAQALSIALDIPIVPVHHMEAHIVANLLDHPDLSLPAIALVVSGGHTMLVHVPEWKRYEVLGQTRDDAAGEAFDKVAKRLGLGFPGGPQIEARAKDGDPESIAFPRPMIGEGYEFSFSGLKTAVARWADERGENEVEAALADVCASFQAAVVDVLVDKTVHAAGEYGVSTVLLGGGVACNRALRDALRQAFDTGVDVLWPQPIHCTDNGAMIARTARLRADEAVWPGAFDVLAQAALV